MRVFKMFLLAGFASFPVMAHADTVTGPYVTLGGGYNLVQSQHGHFSPGTQADGLVSGDGSTSLFRHGPGFTGYGAVGYGVGHNVRIEFEGVYNYSTINHRGGTAVSGYTQSSDQSYGGLVNALYDIDLSNFGINSPVTPYVGVGAGYLWQHYNPVDTHYVNGTSSRLGGTQGSFAYQGIVGASVETGVPGLSVAADYRMLGQDFPSHAYTMTGYTDGEHRGNAGGLGQRFSHQATVSVRYAFGEHHEQVPAVIVLPPPPAPTPARTYLVFFDWDSASLSERAHDVVAKAAGDSTHVAVTRIEVDGYTDTSSAYGGARGRAHNLALSLRRAHTVEEDLIKDGVPENIIAIKGLGDKNPMVPTGPNTREPENRRVEIIIK